MIIKEKTKNVYIWRSYFAKMLNKFRKNKNLFTLIGCILCMAIIFSGVDAMVVIGILGIAAVLLGLIIYKESGATIHAKMMLVTGGYIFIMSAIYLLKLIAVTLFYQIFFAGILLIACIGFVLFKKNR
ncbi:MAG: hypothetical protein MRZ59_06510 [Clostridiales bacterium]|nr:hypothetical protein [Clostridiales bacterium]MDY3746111.1 hypothetical protein [Lachnospiraceae bacterium]